MEDICNFIPPKDWKSNVEYFHFVYEASFRKLHQPFVYSNFYAYLVCKGEGVFKTGEKEYILTPGTLFFTFPAQEFEIKSSDRFTYFYISFNGAGAEELLNQFGVKQDDCVFYNHDHLLHFWMSSIKRITPSNANILTESVFLYTLSYLNSVGTSHKEKNDRFESVMDYINNNFSDPDISITKIAGLFFYSKKYLSTLFMRRNQVRFTDYLNRLRIQFAIKQIQSGETTVSKIATECGFSDPYYFSKVFKKTTNFTPTEFIKNLKI